MHKVHRRLFAACFLLLLSVAARPLRAQVAIDSNGSLPVVTTVPVFYIGSYTGTVTQTTSAGQVTTGTFTLNLPVAVLPNPNAIKLLNSGRLTASITLNGVTTNYTGRLARNDHGVRSTPGIAYLRAVADDAQLLAASVKIPLVVNQGLAYGGIQDEAGTSLTFRGVRDAFASTAGDGK